ncbi:MAG: hypothetical protein HQL08_03585 [Nitrospirae bacterium]|nr:hypothetical protein [Nitrospirota bacterium]
MPLLCPIESLKGNRELVICDGEGSRAAHKELYNFTDDAYFVAGERENVFDMIAGAVDTFNTSAAAGLSRIHLVLGWENILRVSSWKSARPAPGDAFIVLKNAGVSQQDLQPFKNADINDLFPWLYYGKRFNVLRKVCHASKKQLESHLKDHAVRVDCHLIEDGGKRIVASSL